MKTAISIPDPVFDAAEQLADRLGFTRSELYARAIAAFLRDHRDDYVTKALNAVYADEPASVDAALDQMQFATLDDEDWS